MPFGSGRVELARKFAAGAHDHLMKAAASDELELVIPALGRGAPDSRRRVGEGRLHRTHVGAWPQHLLYSNTIEP